MIAKPENGSPFGTTKFSDYFVVHEWRAHAGLTQRACPSELVALTFPSESRAVRK
jgi:hypothetical protein